VKPQPPTSARRSGCREEHAGRPRAPAARGRRPGQFIDLGEAPTSRRKSSTASAPRNSGRQAFGIGRVMA
jgi:hypothetical protein